MVFSNEGQFQQFPHCKFRENVVRLLYIPSFVDHSHQRKSTSHLFLAVNKYGKVGLYHPEKFSLVHTYCLDLSVPVNATSRPTSSHAPVIPKCERTHIVTDAVFSPETYCVIFSTTKNLLQWYDIGEIQLQDIGLGLFPRKEFLSLSETSFPVTNIPNKGHVESHRLFGLNFIPTCLEYHGRKLIIGDVDGGVTLIGVPTPKYPLGRRKIRGKLHKIQLAELPHGLVQYYKAHHGPITDILLISERSLILTSSKDKKFSVYVKDLSDTPMESIIVSIPKGVTSIAYSLELKMVATGGDDCVVRLFNQFVMKMPQMEMFGHRSAVVTVQFVQVDFFVVGAEQGENPVLLLSYSADSELRAWDPLTFICLQSLYLSFPVGSTIMCKTPEFATKSLLVFKPTIHEFSEVSSSEPKDENKSTGFRKKKPKKMTDFLTPTDEVRGFDSGMIILLYCNSFARIAIEKEGSSRWPGIDYDKFIREFEDVSLEYDKKLKEKAKGDGTYHHHTSNPYQYHVPPIVIKEETGQTEDDEEAEKEDQFIDKTTTRAIINQRNDGSCFRLTKDELAQMDLKVDKYLKEIMELRQTIKEASESVPGTGKPVSFHGGNTGRLSESTMEGTDEEEEFTSPLDDGRRSKRNDPLTISVRATNKLFEFRRAKQNQFQGLPKGLQRMISYGQAFNQYPVLELEPVQFSQRNLVIPENMKKRLGIDSVNSVQELMTPEAQKYFGIELTGHTGNRSKSRGGGGSFFYNFNHSQQRKKQSKDSNQPLTEDLLQPQSRRAMMTTCPSRFSVVGQKIRNAYEDEAYSFATPSKDDLEDGEEYEQLDFN